MDILLDNILLWQDFVLDSPKVSLYNQIGKDL